MAQPNDEVVTRTKNGVTTYKKGSGWVENISNADGMAEEYAKSIANNLTKQNDEYTYSHDIVVESMLQTATA